MTWCNLAGGLHPKMAFYTEYFLVIRHGIIMPPSYFSWHWCRPLCISLQSFKASSHELQIQTNHHMDREDWACHLSTLATAETKIQFIFYYSTCYEICGRFYC